MAESQVIKMATMAEMRAFAERNRPPGHPLRPVTDNRHIVYRPELYFSCRNSRHMMIRPPYSFQVFRGRYLLGTVTRMLQGEWFAFPAEKGPGMGSFERRSHAARALLHRWDAGYGCRRFGGLCSLLPNPLWDETKPDRRGPHYCYIARLGGEHVCECLCGILLDLDERRRGDDDA